MMCGLMRCRESGWTITPTAPAQDTVTQWMNSPAHHANIVEQRFVYLGVGVVRGPMRIRSRIRSILRRISVPPSRRPVKRRPGGSWELEGAVGARERSATVPLGDPGTRWRAMAWRILASGCSGATWPDDQRDAKTLSVCNAPLKVGSESHVTIRSRNSTEHIAFLERAEISNERDGNEILPIEYDDNYVTVFPGETAEIDGIIRNGPEPRFVKLGATTRPPWPRRSGKTIPNLRALGHCGRVRHVRPV